MDPAGTGIPRSRYGR